MSKKKPPKPHRLEPLSVYTMVVPISLSGVAMERLEERAAKLGHPLCHILSHVLEESTIMQRGVEQYPDRPDPDGVRQQLLDGFWKDPFNE